MTQEEGDGEKWLGVTLVGSGGVKKTILRVTYLLNDPLQDP